MNRYPMILAVDTKPYSWRNGRRTDARPGV